MYTFQQDRIESLTAQFAKASKILPYQDLGREGQLNKSTRNTDERLMTLQATLIGQLTLLTQTSLDQVLVALEVNRHLEFFGKEIFKPVNAAHAEHEQNGSIVETYFRASEKHLMAAKDLYGVHCSHIVSLDDSFTCSQMHRKTKTFEAGIIKQAQRYFDTQDDLNYLGARDGKDLTLYDADQKPSLQGKTPQTALRDLYEATVENTERVIDQNIGYATTLLVKRQLIQNRIMPIMPHLKAGWDEEVFEVYEKVRGVIDHIGVLSRIHGERSNLLEANFA